LYLYSAWSCKRETGR
jgi:hypothetical protein